MANFILLKEILEWKIMGEAQKELYFMRQLFQ
jgi:hypothetical protein